MFLTGPALTVLAPAATLAPSLTPAAQPTISLLSDANTDSLSVDSLTLLPPADPPCLRHFTEMPADPDPQTTPDLHPAEDRKDIAGLPDQHGSRPNPDPGVIRKDDGPHPHSEPANLSEPDVTSGSRDNVETEIPAPDPEEILDLEQETEID